MTGKGSVWFLWILAPLLLALSMYRPFTPSRGLAQALPTSLPGYTLKKDIRLTPRQTELLGTSDAAWRTYRADDGQYVFMVAVFHEENWKSVHPPQICLKGSNMVLNEEGELGVGGPDLSFSAGRILGHSRSKGLDYLSLYVYGAQDLLTPGYMEFFWHHAPRALLRRATRGFLLRAETYIGEDGVAGAEARCRDFLEKMVPIARELVDS